MTWLSEKHVQLHDPLREASQGLLQRSPEEHVGHQREAHTSSCMKETRWNTTSCGHVQGGNGRKVKYLEHVRRARAVNKDLSLMNQQAKLIAWRDFHPSNFACQEAALFQARHNGIRGGYFACKKKERGSADHTGLHGDSRGLKVYQTRSFDCLQRIPASVSRSHAYTCLPLALLCSCGFFSAWHLECQDNSTNQVWLIAKTNMAMAMQHHHFLFGDTSSNGVFSQCHVSFLGEGTYQKTTPFKKPSLLRCKNPEVSSHSFGRERLGDGFSSNTEVVGPSVRPGWQPTSFCDDKRHFFGTTFCFPKSFFNINLCEIFARQGLRDAERLLPVVQLNCMERNRRTVLLHRSNSTWMSILY